MSAVPGGGAAAGAGAGAGAAAQTAEEAEAAAAKQEAAAQQAADAVEVGTANVDSFMARGGLNRLLVVLEHHLEAGRNTSTGSFGIQVTHAPSRYFQFLSPFKCVVVDDAADHITR
jgi:hypothetical protein